MIRIFCFAILVLSGLTQVTKIGDRSHLNQNVKRFIDRFPTLKKWVENESKTSQTMIQSITQRGFMTFSQSASMQALDSIKPDIYAQFKEAVLTMIDAPPEAKAKLREGVFDLVPFLTHNEWHLFNMMFDVNKQGQTKYVCILAHNNGGKSYDFVIADFRTTFTLAPNLLVLQQKKSSLWGLQSSSRTIIKQIPASITTNDLEVLMNFFDLGAFIRFAKMLEIPFGYSDSQPAVEPSTIIAGISAGIDLWSKFANAFKTKITHEIVKEIAGEGFNKFTMSSVAHMVTGLNPSALDRYISMFPRLYNIPTKYSKQLEDILWLVQVSTAQTWQKNDIMFDVNDGGANAWVTLLSSKNVDGTYNFLICNVKQTFKLAPNLLVIKESKSVLGGIYESEKFKFKTIPRSLTEKDLEQLIAFFNIVTFKRFAAAANIQINKPDPQIIM